MAIDIPAPIMQRIQCFQERGTLGPDAERKALPAFDGEAIATHIALESVVIASADQRGGVDENPAPGEVRFSAEERRKMEEQNPSLKPLSRYRASYEGPANNPTRIVQELVVGPFQCLRISEPDPEHRAIRRYEATLGIDGFQLVATHVEVNGASYLEHVRQSW